MRVESHRPWSVLACALVALFFALSFNAYACLLPVNGVAPAPMEKGCATPDEQPVSQYCDAFKTLGVHTAGKLPLHSDYQTLSQQGTASLAHLVILPSHSSRLSDHPIVGSPQDLLLKISVLRI
jgi:hypothetical protein